MQPGTKHTTGTPVPRARRARRVVAGGGASLLALLATACGGDLEQAGGGAGTPSPTTTVPSSAPPTSAPVERPEPDLDLALSTPQEDSLYPEVGDPGVDALHYDLDLTWDPTTDTLTGEQALTFRATADAEEVRLDLGDPLEVASVSLDGADVAHEHTGKDLVVAAPVTADQRYELAISYAGTPEQVEAPTTRPDLAKVGFGIDPEHQAWALQEPFGAFTWYAVNDHPSDKALYDFTLHVPSPWTGVANGTQLSSEDDGTTRTTTYHLAEPAASYLVTVAFADYDQHTDEGPGGVPITYWTPAGDTSFDAGLRTAPAALRWLEQRLGPYPYDTAGFVVVDSESAIETQTMITVGDTQYSTSPATVLHELAHQWWGNQVTPSDWRDLWMNEGMAMYLQLMWEAEQDGVDLDDYLDAWESEEARSREQAGPFGAFEPDEFGSNNVYIGAALMWHEIREQVGDEPFWSAVRSWPGTRDNANADRDALLRHLEQETGQQLDDLWEAWLLGEESPER